MAVDQSGYGDAEGLRCSVGENREGKERENQQSCETAGSEYHGRLQKSKRMITPQKVRDGWMVITFFCDALWRGEMNRGKTGKLDAVERQCYK